MNSILIDGHVSKTDCLREINRKKKILMNKACHTTKGDEYNSLIKEIKSLEVESERIKKSFI
ncbi:hypothetical protein [Pantoea agglomerans]|uniref:hypothetical protein n=1 Tax=Enterobacter agglomerans TaxID=549 RepID=UPI003C7AE7DB